MSVSAAADSAPTSPEPGHADANATAVEQLDPRPVSGWCDGLQHGHIVGWAWYPEQPQDTVVVQVFANGELVAEGAACIPRPDLKTAGIGHGRHAYAIPFTIDPEGPALLQVVVRAKDGPVLPQGAFEILSSEEARAEALRRRSLDYLESVFGPLSGSAAAGDAGGGVRAGAQSQAAPQVFNFILYSATAGSTVARQLGMPEYSYYFVMRGYREVLRRLGVVHVVRDPAREVDAIYDQVTARGEACVFLSFAPPQSTTLHLRCPTVPVIAWEFSTIPEGGWDENALNDWHRVLRQTGRALTISDFAARAVQAGMGRGFPVISVPTPVWDRLARLRTPAPRPARAVRLDGFVWDSRVTRLALDSITPALPMPPARNSAAAAAWRRPGLTMAEASVAEHARLREAHADCANHAAIARADVARISQEAALEQLQSEAEASRALAETLAEIAAEQRRFLHAHVAGQAGIARLAALAGAMEAVELRLGELTLREARLQEDRRMHKTLRHRLGLTRRLLREWYATVLRNGRNIRRARAAGMLSFEDQQAQQNAQVLAQACQAREAALALIAAGDHAGIPDFAEPVREAQAAWAHRVGESLRIAEEARLRAERNAEAWDVKLRQAALAMERHTPYPPRYAPAPEGEGLPEPSLAVFIPDPCPAPPAAPAAPPAGCTVALDGVVFTAVLSPKDGRKNWQDMLTAFTAAMREHADATLVLKMIGTDAAYWWWEFHDLARTIPPFACRVLVMQGFLPDAEYEGLIAASDFVVNSSLAEGQCLPLVEFMSGGKPAIAPRHTAMLDYITDDNALIVASDPEFCAWPHDPRNHLITTRHRIAWPSLRDAFTQAYHIAKTDPERHARMGAAAARSVRGYCADDVLGPRLAAFLGMDAAQLRAAGWQPECAPPVEALGGDTGPGEIGA